MEIAYIYRSKKQNLHSIENVFQTLTSLNNNEDVIKEYFVPEFGTKLSSIRKNISFVKKIKADVYHITGDIHYLTIALPKNKTVLTIHDLVGLQTKKYNIIKKIMYLIFWVIIPIMRAKIVTVISVKTKNEVLKYTFLNKKKVKVVPDPLNQKFEFHSRTFNKSYPNILLIGTSLNKNHSRIYQAARNLDAKFTIIGTLTDNEKSELRTYNIQYSNYSNISQEEIVNAYIDCDIVLFPSLYEGFGLPIIEGQRTGRIVITSSIEPMKSVSGNCAIFVDPLSVESIRSGLIEAIENDSNRATLINCGVRNSYQYEPQMIYMQYKKIYIQLFEGGRLK